MNWLPLGLTYAFLYMGRYNLTVSKNAFGDLMTNADFGTIFGVGTIVYGFAFVINGPLTDKMGGRKAILIAALGSALANFFMGLLTYMGKTSNLVLTFSILYGLNMYFQSFGAVAIVKVNSAWFHLRERGTFGGIFGILISLGLYFAYDWGAMITKNFSLPYVFFIPTIILFIFFMISYAVVRDTPAQAGYANFDTADLEHEKEGEQLGALHIAKRMFSHKVIVIISLIEFCSGFIRHAIMNEYIIFAKQTGIINNFVAKNWGLLLCCAGILGGVFAGTISDKVFQSRRGPVSAVLYGFMLVGSIAMCFLLESPYLGWLMVFMSMAIIGVHGMLSGTASMDFGGKKNVGTAVGIIDGMVYLGAAAQSLIYGSLLPSGEAEKTASNWITWPIMMMPIALVGFVLAMKIWNSRADGKSGSAH